MEDPTTPAATASIDRLLASWAAAIEAGDVDAIAAHVTADAEFWSNGAVPLVGRDAVRQAMASAFQRFALSQRFDCAELVIRDDLAFMRGTEHNILQPRDGGPATAHDQRAFSVMQRGVDGVWRFWRGMTNLPPKGDR